MLLKNIEYFHIAQGFTHRREAHRQVQKNTNKIFHSFNLILHYSLFNDFCRAIIFTAVIAVATYRTHTDIPLHFL